MKNYFALFFFVISALSVYPQTSLDNCIESALESHPALKNREAFDQINLIDQENNHLKRYPLLSVGGQAKYQSDVVSFDFDLPFEGISFPEVPHFQYNLSLNANQILYDGGQRKLELELLQLEHQERSAGIDVIAREIKQKVQELYLNIILQEKQLEVIKMVEETLKVNSERLEYGLKGGVALEMDLKLLEAEIIDVRRKILTISESRSSLIKQLALLCNIDLDSDQEFIIPTVNYLPQSPDRYEYEVFSYRDKALEVKKDMMVLKKSPRLSAFGQAGVGKPGLNFMSDKMQDFYVVGLQFSWIPWDYGESKRRVSLVDISRNILKNEKEAFDLQLTTAMDMVVGRIRLSEKLIDEDEKMVEIRRSIRQDMETRLTEGIITSADYITELNREKQARLELEKSKLDLLANKLAYKVITNK